MLANESRRLVNEMRKLAAKQKNQERQQRKFIRTMFNLLAKLYPERADTITDEMQEFYVTDSELFQRRETRAALGFAAERLAIRQQQTKSSSQR